MAGSLLSKGNEEAGSSKGEAKTHHSPIERREPVNDRETSTHKGMGEDEPDRQTGRQEEGRLK